MDDLIFKLNQKGDQIFLHSSPPMNFQYLHTRTLTGDTYRGFHMIDKLKPGPKNIFEKYFAEKKAVLISQMLGLKTEEDLNLFEIEICKELKSFLKANINNLQLISYNKIRKPVDIAIEHFMAMATECNDCRGCLTNFLFLPLDSSMFQSHTVFSDRDIFKLRIKRSFTFKDIKERSHYVEIQKFLKEKAVDIGLKNRIYFDLLHRDRYNSSGTNLLTTNN